MNTLLKRGRGRPVGSKDKKSRYRPVRPVPEVLKSPAMTVEQKVKLLSDPQKLSVYAKITGLSVGVLRKKVTRGEIQAFHRDGLLRVEPLHFLNWYNGARLPKREPRAPDWEKQAILQLAAAAISNAPDRATFERIANRARLLTYIPEDRWQEIEWLDED